MSQLPLETVAEAIPHIVWLSDASGSTNYVNTLATQYTGLPRQAIYGWGWVDLVHPDDAERARLGWSHATRTVTPFELTYRLRRRDGEYHWHALKALPIRSEGGEIIRWLGTADDLADPTLALDDDALLAQQVGQFRALLDAEPDDPPPLAPTDATELVTTDEPIVVATADQAAAIATLAPRDRAVARLVGRGHTNAEIATLLGYSLRTIEAHRNRLRRLLGVRTRAELVQFVHDHGLDEPD